MTDEWEAMRGHVRGLQADLAAAESRYKAAHQSLVVRLAKEEISRRHFDFACSAYRMEVEEIEEMIILVREKMPPWASYADGVTTLHPVTDRIDPREPV